MALLREYAIPEIEPVSPPAAPHGGRAKRSMDVLFAIAILLFVAPLMLFIALAIWVQDRGPVFFVQDRVGFAGRSFRCFKFRSMVTDAEARMQALLAADPAAAREWQENQKLANDPRVTPLGRWLRKSSFDELPQFLNVLGGSMSVVGPRPILIEQIPAYGAAFEAYCSARPGITGLWQVSGRNGVSFRGRSELDETYLGGWSLGGDLGLVVRTVGVVLTQRGAS
jgi:exopolysaccharide production protein ExoY